MNAGLVDEFVARVLEAIAAGDRVEPPALQLLVRQYASTGHEPLAAPLSASLAVAFDDPAGADPTALLALCADAAHVSDDGRLAGVAARLAAVVRGAWAGGGPVADVMRGIDACLRAADVAAEPTLLPAAIDEMERIVGRSYEPGEGVGEGALVDQLAAAAALLTAYDRTGRVPYAMLADEIMHVSRRKWWRADAGVFDAAGEGVDSFAANCAAAGICCRLAALHADAEYREAAAVAPEADYAADAGRVLAAAEGTARARGSRGAAYALALAEWLALGRELH